MKASEGEGKGPDIREVGDSAVQFGAYLTVSYTLGGQLVSWVLIPTKLHLKQTI